MRVNFEKNSIETDGAVVCYGPSIKVKEPDKRAENSNSKSTQPLETKKKGRGRPSREELAAQRLVAEDERREQEHARLEQTKATRFGRLSRPPDRL